MTRRQCTRGLGKHDQRTDVCSPLCDAEPVVTFTDEYGVEINWCLACYHKPCGRCGERIVHDHNRRKGLCQACRDTVPVWTERADESGPDDCEADIPTPPLSCD